MAQNVQIKGRVIVYTVLGCPSCMAAKNKLARLGVPYVEVNLDDYDSQVMQTLVNRTGKRSMPQIFFNGIFVGGYDDLATLTKDELQVLVDEVIHNAVPPSAPVVPCIGAMTMGSSLAEHRERDQHASVVEDLTSSRLIQTHRRGIRLYRKSFVAEEFVQWLSLNEKYSYDHHGARAVGEELLRRKFIRRLTREGDHNQFRADAILYRLLDDEEWEALNAGPVSLSIPREAVELSKALQVLMKKIYAQYVSSDGKTVDYLGIARDPNFKVVESVACELQRARLETLSREETMAFFINIYNCIVIHWNARMGSPAGLLSRSKVCSINIL
ncbi:GLRX2 [Branchiostoma lanceolatum]|uniref:GLRX2 protein n=1 Tax=Branchiostoma lanceolatum TaxID=7740 RepID=A0A8K0F155_BRALA|nr:GLRX2 [Branchiostoma lanceolatum]